jgi:hypothetical protein
MLMTDQNNMQVRTSNLIQNETAVIISPMFSSNAGATEHPTRLLRIAAAFVSLRENMEWPIACPLLSVLSKYLAKVLLPQRQVAEVGTRPAMACRFRIFVLELTLFAHACLYAARVKLSSKPRLLHQCDLYGGGEGHLARPEAHTPRLWQRGTKLCRQTD